jgi:hypothetical protein
VRGHRFTERSVSRNNLKTGNLNGRALPGRDDPDRVYPDISTYNKRYVDYCRVPTEPMKFHKILIERYLPLKTRRRDYFEFLAGKYFGMRSFLFHGNDTNPCSTQDLRSIMREMESGDFSAPPDPVPAAGTFAMIGITEDLPDRDLLRAKLIEIQQSLSRR